MKKKNIEKDIEKKEPTRLRKCLSQYKTISKPNFHPVLKGVQRLDEISAISSEI